MAATTPNTRTVETYLNGFRTLDRALILSCLTDDVEWVIPGVFETRGKAGFAEHIVETGFAATPPADHRDADGRGRRRRGRRRDGAGGPGGRRVHRPRVLRRLRHARREDSAARQLSGGVEAGGGVMPYEENTEEAERTEKSDSHATATRPGPARRGCVPAECDGRASVSFETVAGGSAGFEGRCAVACGCACHVSGRVGAGPMGVSLNPARTKAAVSAAASH